MASAAAIAAEIRSQIDNPGAVKLHKLLYYCQGWHLVWAGESLFPEALEAWSNGPVVASLWRAENRFGRQAPEPITAVERRTVTYVARRYGHLTGNQLIGATHQEDPWREARTRGNNSRLSLELMRGFFAADLGSDQAWFWDESWLGGELEADADLRAGRSTVDLSGDAFMESMSADRADI